MELFNLKYSVLSIFVVTYILIIVFYNKKLLIVWAFVGVLLLSRNVTVREAWAAIDWNIILLYFGMLLVREVFLFSKMPYFVASLLASKAKRVSIAMLFICLFTGVLSIALENVAVVLLVAPIGASDIVAMGIIRKNGYSVKFMDFVKIGLPFSVAAVSASSLFIWVIFK